MEKALEECNTDNFKIDLSQICGETYNIENYGGVGDGKTSNTEVFARAIAAASEAGGGIVEVPAGIWLTGPIELKSNIELHICSGAIVIFDKNPEEYPVVQVDYEGQITKRCVSPIHAEYAQNIAITGKGILDGNGQLWRPVKRWKVTEREWQELKQQSSYVTEAKDGEIWMPSEDCDNGSYDTYRPVMVRLERCHMVLIEGVTFQNSPAWNIHTLFCSHLTVRNTVIRNPYYAQNGDGLDVESCRKVHIHDVQLDVGDDAICLKSGKGAEARKTIGATEDVYIHDCSVYHGHGGFVVGSEMSRGVKNVTVENCIFAGTDVGIRFKSALGRGGIVENIVLDRIQMLNIKKEAILFDMGYIQGYEDSPGELMDFQEEDIPEFRNIYMRSIRCKNAEMAIRMNGLKQKPLHDIWIEDSWFQTKNKMEAVWTKEIHVNSVTYIS